MKTIPFVLFLLNIQLIGQNNIQLTEKQTNIKSYIPYFLKCYEADSLYFAKNYEKSYQILDSLFREYEPKNSFMIYEFETYVKSGCQIGNYDKINDKISKMIGDFGYEREYFLSDSSDVLYKGFLNANIVENTYGLLRFNYLSKIDREMRKEMYSMDYYARHYGRNFSLDETEDKDKLDIIENYKDLLLNWFDIGIYPNENAIGNYNVDEYKIHGLFEIINQFDSYTFFKTVEPKLKYFLEKGECTPYEYAHFLDVREFLMNKTSKYMTISMNINFQENEGYSKVNLERKNIGLPSVEYSLWKMNLWEDGIEKQE